MYLLNRIFLSTITSIVLMLFVYSFNYSLTLNEKTQPAKIEDFIYDHSVCPERNSGLIEKSRKNIEKILESESQTDIQKKDDLGIGNLTTIQIRQLKDPSDSSECHAIASFMNEYQVFQESGNNNERIVSIYYEVGDFYFVPWVSDGLMLGFSPVYIFDNNINLIFIWVI
mgnify:CR=1 FL=1